VAVSGWLLGVQVVELSGQLHLVKPVFGQVYLWRDGSQLTMVDTGIPGSQDDLAQAFAELGYRRGDLRRVVITYGHEDHAGAAGAVREWGDVQVLAHRADAPIIRGERRRADPSLTAAERPRYDRVAGSLPNLAPCPVDTEVDDGDTIDFGGGLTWSPPLDTPTAASASGCPPTAYCSPATALQTKHPACCSIRSIPIADGPASPPPPCRSFLPMSSASDMRSTRQTRVLPPGANSACCANTDLARSPIRSANSPTEPQTACRKPNLSRLVTDLRTVSLPNDHVSPERHPMTGRLPADVP
jgi:Zn-dependent hydrolases, including glyoxylases